MLSCKDFNERSSAWLADELSWRERLSMRMHWLMCHHCRRWLRQLRALILGVRHMHGEADDQEVARVLERIREEETQAGQ